MPTAVISVRNMLDAAIRGDGVLMPLLSGKRVYTGKALAGAALPYIVLGQTTESPFGASYYNHRPGHEGTESIHIWGRSKWGAQTIWEALVNLLDNQRPVLYQHVVVKGMLEYVTDMESEKPQAWLVVARYRIRSRVEV